MARRGMSGGAGEVEPVRVAVRAGGLDPCTRTVSPADTVVIDREAPDGERLGASE